MRIQESVVNGNLTAFNVVKLDNGEFSVAIMSPDQVAKSHGKNQSIMVDSIHSLWGNELALEYCYLTNTMVMEGRPFIDNFVDLNGFIVTAAGSIKHCVTPIIEVYRNLSKHHPKQTMEEELVESILKSIKHPQRNSVFEIINSDEYKDANEDMYMLGRVVRCNPRYTVSNLAATITEKLKAFSHQPALQVALVQSFEEGVHSKGNVSDDIFSALNKQQSQFAAFFSQPVRQA